MADWLNDDRVIVALERTKAEQAPQREELYSFADRYPGVKAFDGVTREEMMQYLMMFNEDTFIDWDTGVCHFDSEGFKSLLKYVCQFPDFLASGREEEALSDKMRNGEVLFAIKEASPYMMWDYEEMFHDNECVSPEEREQINFQVSLIGKMIEAREKRDFHSVNLQN